MLESILNRAHNNNMERAPHISKAAFLARINERARRFAVDCRHEKQGDKSVLVIKYDNGQTEIFSGLKAA